MEIVMPREYEALFGRVRTAEERGHTDELMTHEGKIIVVQHSARYSNHY